MKPNYQTNVLFQTIIGVKEWKPLMVFEDFDIAELEYFRTERDGSHKKVALLVNDVDSFSSVDTLFVYDTTVNSNAYVFVLYQEDDPGWFTEVYDNEQDAIKVKEELEILHKEESPDGKYYFPIVVQKCELNTNFGVF